MAPHPAPLARQSALDPARPETARILCSSVFNSDLPYDRQAARYVRVLEGVLMGQSISANASFRTRILATVPLHPDGSFFVEVPADLPLRFQLLDEDGRMLVHETACNYARGGETKGCAGCHESPRDTAPNQRPLALNHPPLPALREAGELI